jgi:hypothetical protein
VVLVRERLQEIIAELSSRPGHEKVRALIYELLVYGLGASSRDVDFERPVPEVRGRIDALLGQTVFEFKRDLRRERATRRRSSLATSPTASVRTDSASSASPPMVRTSLPTSCGAATPASHAAMSLPSSDAARRPLTDLTRRGLNRLRRSGLPQ